MATWVVGIMVALAAAGAVWKIISDQRAGKSSCSGDCSRCRGCR